MRLYEAMTLNPQTISLQATVRDAALLMQEQNVGILPVMENDAPIGVVTDRDLALRALTQSNDPSNLPISEVMTPEILWMYEDEYLDDAIEAMIDRKISRLLVKNRSGKLIGILSAADISTISARKRVGDLMSALGGTYRQNHIATAAVRVGESSTKQLI